MGKVRLGSLCRKRDWPKRLQHFDKRSRHTGLAINRLVRPSFLTSFLTEV
jgi:hypothetical protein